MENNERSAHFMGLARDYWDIDEQSVMAAFKRTNLGALMNNPLIQNKRVKNINSLPVGWTKNEITGFLKSPYENEEPLRQISQALAFTAYPYKKIIKTYQDILTYRWYTYPANVDDADTATKQFKREWMLVDKIGEAFRPEQTAHKIVGQCATYGKVFYYPRYSVDKTHNACNAAIMQQLPEDWTRIVGYNSVSGYTVSFNMMYFMTPGTSTTQFGDLFKPYIDDFGRIMSGVKVEPKRKAVYASHDSDAHAALKRLKEAKTKRDLAGDPDVFVQNGVWFYWVTLPIEKIWTFEIDDTTPAVVSPLSGLILSMAQISQYEDVQMQIVQNPLVSIVLAEMACRDGAEASADDPIKISPAVRKLYEYLWYSMLDQNNTSGIGLFAAPFENMKLEQLSEAPNGSEIAAKGYAYAVQKSGIGLIPTSTEPRVGAINVSAQIEARYAAQVYRQYERMMNYIFKDQNLKYEWRYKMFGDIFSEEKDLKNCKDGMTLGLLVATLRYNAILGHRLSDDVAISSAVINSGVLDKRLPLISSYSAKAGGGLPPTAGRPPAEEVTTEGQEADEDEGV